MFCAECGDRIPEGAAFCGNCGVPIDRAAAMATSRERESPVVRVVEVIAPMPDAAGRASENRIRTFYRLRARRTMPLLVGIACTLVSLLFLWLSRRA